LTVAFTLLILVHLFAWTHLNKTELTYFTFDSTGFIAFGFALLCIPTIYHGFIYTTGDDATKHSIYHASLVA
jgi:hypothetical protein